MSSFPGTPELFLWGKPTAFSYKTTVDKRELHGPRCGDGVLHQNSSNNRDPGLKKKALSRCGCADLQSQGWGQASRKNMSVSPAWAGEVAPEEEHLLFKQEDAWP